MHARLAAVGLAERRESMMLGALIDQFIESRVDVKRATAIVFGHTKRCLIEHFGRNRALRSITPGEADGWRLKLIGEGLAEATVGRRCGIAKQIFRAAQRRKLIEVNPFADLKSRVRGNADRSYFLSREDAAKVLEACPDAQWCLLFALSRYAGLRCPSEHLALKWADIDWERGRFLVHSVKTERHAGKESRWVPIFPELRPYLLDAFEQAEPGVKYVITRYRDTNANLRTQLQRIIRKAGLTPWPKLFHNLRATRQTELAEKYPLHVVCAWIGNSRAVAAEHYLQVTDAHFAQASAEPDAAVPEQKVGAAQNAAHLPDFQQGAAQNPAQYPAKLDGMEQKEGGAGKQNRPDLPSDSASYDLVQIGEWAVQGSNL